MTRFNDKIVLVTGGASGWKTWFAAWQTKVPESPSPIAMRWRRRRCAIACPSAPFPSPATSAIGRR